MANALVEGCGRVYNPRVVRMSGSRILNLSEDIIRLVNDGIYSLYSIANSEKLVLITDTRDYYLVDELGNLESKLDSLSGFQLQSAIRVQDLKKYPGFKVNYA